MLFIASFFGCHITKESIQGAYTAVGNDHNLDSLFVEQNGQYFRKLYSLKDTALIFEQSGSWRISDGRIHLSDFFIDENRVYPKNYAFNAVVIGATLEVDKMFGNIKIQYSPWEAQERYYQKVNNK